MALDFVNLSRTVSHALRHEPWLYELELDDDGWASVDAVVHSLRGERAEWKGLIQADLVHMIAASSKRRHEISHGRIRALYGHSIPGKLRKAMAVPPTELYHGTAPDTLATIRESGLLPMNRHYVHLSVDEATAAEVGRRKARQPVILKISAAAAHGNGVPFYEGNERVWLADQVPTDFIVFDRANINPNQAAN